MDIKEYKALVNELGLDHEKIARDLGLKLGSYKRQIQPSAKTPKWAKAFVIACKASKL